MNKKGLAWLAVIIFCIAFCGTFYQYQIHRTTGDSSMMEIADINTTASASSASKNLTGTSNTTNQTAFTVPLEKPPFIE